MISDSYKRNKGVTLIELIVAIVIITIAVSGITALFYGTASTSADPMIRAQSLAIAQSYMDEIFMQPYASSADTTVTGVCLDGNPPEKSARAKYNDVSDYNGLSDTGAHDQSGCLIDELTGYNVVVSVNVCTSQCSAEMNAISAKKILVTVTHIGLGTSVPMTAYKADY